MTQEELNALKARNNEFSDCDDPSHLSSDGGVTERIGTADIAALIAEVERLRHDMCIAYEAGGDGDCPHEPRHWTEWPSDLELVACMSLTLERSLNG